MKTKKNHNRLLSVVLCAVLCLSLLPVSAAADESAEPAVTEAVAVAADPAAETYLPAAAPVPAELMGAYVEGAISGTTGTGTMRDPVVCDTFSELKSAMEDTRFKYVQLNLKHYLKHHKLLLNLL